MLPIYYFAQTTSALYIIWLISFVWRETGKWESRVAFVALGLLVSISLLIRASLSDLWHFNKNTYSLLVPIAAGELVCAATFVSNVRTRLICSVIAGIIVIIPWAIVIVGDFKDDSWVKIISVFLAIVLTLGADLIASRNYLQNYEHGARTKRGRRYLLYGIALLPIFMSPFVSSIIGTDSALAVALIADLGVVVSLSIIGFAMFRLTSYKPGRHLRRDGVYSAIVGFGTGWVILLCSTYSSYGWFASPNTTALHLGLITGACIIFIQPHVFTIQCILVKLFTSDIEANYRRTIEFGNSLVSNDDIAMMLANQLDELRYELGGRRAKLEIESHSLLQFASIDVPSKVSVSWTELLNSRLSIIDSGQIVAYVEIGFEKNAVWPSNAGNFILNFQNKFIHLVEWYRFQQHYLLEYKSARIPQKLSAGLNLTSESKGISSPNYQIDGPTPKHRFYQDLQIWIENRQSGQEKLSPLTQLQAIQFRSPNNPATLLYETIRIIINTQIPDGLRPKTVPDVNDPHWLRFAILYMGIVEQCTDRAICRRLGMEYLTRNTSEIGKLLEDGNGLETADLYFGNMPKSRSNATYRRRKREAIIRLAQHLMEQDAHIAY